MSPNVESFETTLIEELLAEFNEVLRLSGRPDFSLLDRCPAAHRKELLSLMNVAALAFRALEPERNAFRMAKAKSKASR